jgi:hypothetical protein
LLWGLDATAGDIETASRELVSGCMYQSLTSEDGKKIEVDPLAIKDVEEMKQIFDRYSRQLKIKADISDA